MKKNIIKILYFCGILFLLISLVFIIIDKIIIGVVFLFVSVLLLIPNFWNTYKHETERDKERWAGYRLLKFFGLIMVLVICVIFFVIKIVKL